MGLLVRDILERAQEEIFEAGGVARPGYDVQEGAITAGATSLTLEGRHANVPSDGIIEWVDDTMEIAEVKSVSGTSVTLQTRGYLGSGADAHADGTKVIIDPPFPRYLLLNALKAVVGQLFGYGLYAKGYDDSKTLNFTSPVQLATGAKDVLQILWRNGSNWFPLDRNSYRVLHDYSGVDSAPAVQFFYGGSQGAELRIVYSKDFDLDPFTLSTDLDTVGVSSTLQPHLSMGLAGHVLAGRDVPGLEAEHIRPTPRQPEQPGVHINVGRALWTSFLSGPVATERNRQLRTYPMNIVYERAY